MTEKEMRQIVNAILHKVVFPTTLGMGLALGAGCEETAVKYAAPHIDASSIKDSGNVPKYAAPMLDAAGVLYAAPFQDAGVSIPDGNRPSTDGAIAPRYSTVFPDSRPSPDKSPVTPKYAAPIRS